MRGLDVLQPTLLPVLILRALGPVAPSNDLPGGGLTRRRAVLPDKQRREGFEHSLVTSADWDGARAALFMELSLQM